MKEVEAIEELADPTTCRERTCTDADGTLYSD